MHRTPGSAFLEYPQRRTASPHVLASEDHCLRVRTHRTTFVHDEGLPWEQTQCLPLQMIEFAGELPLSGETWSTPAIIATPQFGVIVTADVSGDVSAFKGSDLSLLWRRSFGSRITSSPLPSRIPGTNSDDVCIGTHDGDFLHLDPITGEIRKRISLGEVIRAVPAAADINGDGHAEIVIATYGPIVSAIDGEGRVIWQKRLPKHLFVEGTKRGIVSAPLVCDVDGDGVPEIVVGTRSARLFCLDARNGSIKWFVSLRYDPDSSPSFAVVDGIPIVLFGGGEHTGGSGDNALIALDGRSGKRLWSTPAGGGIDCAPTIARLTEGGPPLAFACSLASGACIAVDVKSGRELWRHLFGPTGTCDHSQANQCRRSSQAPYFTENAICRSYTTPLVADIDGDGRLEVVVGSNNGSLNILDAELGTLRYHEDTNGMVRGSAVLADADMDGNLELIVPSGSRLLVYRTRARKGAWPMFKGRPDHLGALFTPPAIQVPVVQKPPASLPLRLFWHFVVLDAARWVLCKLDERVLRPIGLRLFEYHY